MPTTRHGRMLLLCSIFSLLTLSTAVSFAEATPVSDSILPDAPAPQTSTQSITQSVQQTVQQTGSAAINTVANTANKVANTGLTTGERFLNNIDAGYLGVSGKWDVTVSPGVQPRPFTKREKLEYAGRVELSPVTIFDISWSAGYEQLRDSNPKYGSDEAAFGERLGAAAFRQATFRLFGDGVFPAMWHQDPRYYRIGQGGLWHRSTRSAVQVLVTHRDDGKRALNYSTFAGEAIANTLPLTFYPQPSVKASVALSGFGYSLLEDAALKLSREFLPDLFRAARLVPAGR